MDISRLKPYAKAVAAAAGALVTTTTLISDGEVSADDVVAILAVWGTVWGVYQIANTPTLDSVIKKGGKFKL